jgi:hypothetical protein
VTGEATQAEELGKRWSVIPRLYAPLKPWFDKTWRRSEIELVN